MIEQFGLQMWMGLQSGLDCVALLLFKSGCLSFFWADFSQSLWRDCKGFRPAVGWEAAQGVPIPGQFGSCLNSDLSVGATNKTSWTSFYTVM